MRGIAPDDLKLVVCSAVGVVAPVCLNLGTGSAVGVVAPDDLKVGAGSAMRVVAPDDLKVGCLFSGGSYRTCEGRNYFICRSPELIDLARLRARTLIIR
jgi:hypothetical protein